MKRANRIRRLAAAFLAAALLSVPAALFTGCGQSGSYEPVTVTVLSIGKADAILIRSASHLVVIDTGTKDDGLTVADAVRKAGNRVDALILTHPDKDHVGGVKKVMKKNEVSTVYVSDYDLEDLEEVRQTVREQGVEPQNVSDVLTLSFDDAVFTIYPSHLTFLPDDDDASNMSSLAVLVTHGNNRLLFAGDAEKGRLTELLGQIPTGGIGFLKVPHHGVACGKSEKFLKTIAPKYAVITCSEEQAPDALVLSALESVGAQVFLTTDGEVKVTSDGKTIVIG